MTATDLTQSLTDPAHFALALPNLYSRKLVGYDKSGRRSDERIGVVTRIQVDCRPDLVLPA